MIKKSTQNYLLQYIYNELSYVDRIEVAANIATDVKLHALHNRFRTSMRTLSNAVISPSSLSVQKILDFSRRSPISL